MTTRVPIDAARGDRVIVGDPSGPASPLVLAGFLDGLAARTIRHRRRPVLHLTGWHQFDDRVAVDALGAALHSPLFVVRGDGTTPLRDALAGIVGGDRSVRWRHWHAALRLIGAEEERAGAAGLSVAWLKFVGAAGSALLVAVAAVLQSVGPGDWTTWVSAVAASVVLAVISAVATVPEIRDATMPRRLAGPLRGRMDLNAWTAQVRGDPSEADQVLCRALLLDLIYEWRWRAFFAPRPIRGPYPVLLVGATVPGVRTLIEQYGTFESAPLLMVTDAPGNGPSGTLERSRDSHPPEWTIDATDLPTTSTRPAPGRGGRVVTALRWGYRRLVVPPRPRAMVAAGIAAVVLLAGAAVALGARVGECDHTLAARVTVTDGERIGYQYCGTTFLAAADLSRTDPADVRNPEQLIYTENERVGEEIARGERNAVTILLITSLTHNGDVPFTPYAEREGLAGAYLAQRRLNTLPDRHPLVRIAVVNAGGGGGHIELLPALVHELLNNDPTVIAAVVTVDSRRNVHTQLQRIGEGGLALASPTMNADGFGADLPGFIELSAPNANNAQLALDYIASAAPGATVHTVLTPDPDDLYTTTLASAMQRANPHGSRVLVESWTRRDVPSAKTVATMCSVGPGRQVVYYAGRYTYFADFITDLQTECGSNLPLLVADDSVSRFLFDPDLAGRLAHGTGVVVTVRGTMQSCASLRAPPPPGTAPGVVGRRADFLSDVAALHRCTATSDPSVVELPGSWSLAMYDAFRMVYDGLRRTLLHAPDVLDSPGQALRRQIATTLEEPGHASAGVIEPLVLDSHRVATSLTSLYCIPDLSEAFTTDTPPILVGERSVTHENIPKATSPCAATP